MPELLASYSAGGEGVATVATYGASGILRRQVEAGAPVDGVILASPQEIDRLVDGGFCEAGTRRVVATNRIVLIGSLGAPRLSFASLDRLPADWRISIGDPRTVPAGRYAREALRNLGFWRPVVADASSRSMCRDRTIPWRRAT